MGLRVGFAAGCVLLLAVVVVQVPSWAGDPPPAQAKAPDPAAFQMQVVSLLQRHCVSCHGGDKPKGNLSLDAFKDEAAALKAPAVWDKVAQNLRTGSMPPPSRRKPDKADVDQALAWIDARFGAVDCTKQRDPGRVTIRRLNRAEYNNTIRDLVGIDFQPADDFPADDVGYGFDNIGDVLSLPPLLMEKYLAAADKIVEKAWKTPDARKRILICQPTDKDQTDCARKTIEAFATRAYRRPLTADEVARLAGFVELAQKNGDDFETGIQLAVKATLVSPNFLFRIERDPPPGAADAGPHPISDFELATRLSYFLWSSMPDDELFEEARQGTLRKEGHLEAQVGRMLKDVKARALVENFAGQWLQIRNLKTVSPDTGRFPLWGDALRNAMGRETELFFETVVREDRSILEFIDADFTFVNEPLAKLYGIDGVKGEAFRRVQLRGGQRGGVLTQASILTITSNPTRTSPVKRGKWILENILGTPPPPPPPNVPELNEKQEALLSGSLRKRMEQHRENPNCASCHARMDPLGFGFENYDAIGAWRTRDGNFPVDPSGVLPGGQSFNGPAELKVILKEQKDLFARCLADRLLTYALGRGLEPYDKCAVDDVAAGTAKNQYKFTSLVLEVVKSDPFQMRRGRKK
jgi:mono/diheme cytochrome c family protein